MFQNKGSQYPPWSEKKRNEPHKMPIKTSVELNRSDSIITKLKNLFVKVSRPLQTHPNGNR